MLPSNCSSLMLHLVTFKEIINNYLIKIPYPELERSISIGEIVRAVGTPNTIRKRRGIKSIPLYFRSPFDKACPREN